METKSADLPSRCSACGTAFRCGAEAGDAACWCFELPKVAAVPGEACLCPKCLKEKAQAPR